VGDGGGALLGPMTEGLRASFLAPFDKRFSAHFFHEINYKKVHDQNFFYVMSSGRSCPSFLAILFLADKCPNLFHAKNVPEH
jgi:hypothetical protein